MMMMEGKQPCLLMKRKEAGAQGSLWWRGDGDDYENNDGDCDDDDDDDDDVRNNEGLHIKTNMTKAQERAK